jgi:hypothetical protein
MIADNREPLAQAFQDLKAFSHRTAREVREQQRAADRLPNAPQGDTDAQLARITVTEYQHITSEVTRISNETSATVYTPFGV